VDEFNHLAVFISMILGLGVAQLLSGFGRWIEQRTTFRAYGPAIAWAGILLVAHVQAWWSMFGLQHQIGWTFLQFWVVLLGPIVLFLLATLVLPGSGAAELDLHTNYFAQRRWFFGLLLGFLALSVAKDLILSGTLPSPANLAFHALLFVTAAIAIATDHETYHLVFAYTSIASMVLYVTLLFAHLE
jgi:hypothetical protein